MGYNTIVAAAVGHWRLQDNAPSTTIVDELGNYDGTLVNAGNTSVATTTGPGVAGLSAAIGLDGSDDYINLPHAFGVSGTDARTIAAYVKRDAVGDSCALFTLNADGATGTRWTVRTEGTTDGLRIEITTNSYASSLTVTDDTWHHVACVFDGTTLADHILYVDGSSEAASGASAVNTTDDTDNYLGRTSAGNFWDGAIADVVYLGSALSATDIAELAAGPEPTNTVAPVCSLNSASGTLNCTDGTWDAQNNGTATFTKQWCLVAPVFDGVGDYATVTIPAIGTQDFEIEFTINMQTPGASKFVFDLDGTVDCDCFVSSGGSLIFRINHATVSSAPSVTGSQHTVRIVADRDGNCTLYVDGVQTDQDDMSNSASSDLSATTLNIASTSTPSSYLPGTLCNFKVTIAGVLVCHLPMDDNSGTTLVAKVGNNGTVTLNSAEATFWSGYRTLSGKTGGSYRPPESGNYKCLVAASNNGGNDANEDTFSNTLSFTYVGPDLAMSRQERWPLHKMVAGLRG